MKKVFLIYQRGAVLSNKVIDFFVLLEKRVPSSDLRYWEIGSPNDNKPADFLQKEYNIPIGTYNRKTYKWASLPVIVIVESSFGSAFKHTELVVDNSTIDQIISRVINEKFPDKSIDSVENPPAPKPSGNKSMILIGLAVVVGFFLLSKSKR